MSLYVNETPYTSTISSSSLLILLFFSLSGALGVFLLVFIIYYINCRYHNPVFLRYGNSEQHEDLMHEETVLMQTASEEEIESYFRAKAFQEANPPGSMLTDISLSQFMSIQEKGVSAWEFEAFFENMNCFVEARTEITFYDSECSVQTNLPIPKTNEIYYWEAKMHDFPDYSTVSIGLTTKPYPLYRLPGWNKHSVGYISDGSKRNNQPFSGKSYGPGFRQGDVVGVGYKPRTGTVFFTRNGKRLEDAAQLLKSNLFPTVGANGPCQIHVNFGQYGFVFIEANVKKWGLAPMVGTLAPPPAYQSALLTPPAYQDSISFFYQGQQCFLNRNFIPSDSSSLMRGNNENVVSIFDQNNT
ncbi:unnamed protein product [Pneumocystis jirovecii]|uniref:B30.2/SPRY domain-containing protein n=2 Tax=Pneumocystis jirovecii TaxID=42068 RepID=L0PDX3_PNEJI|nr:uncharacterized protein T551_00992 [Pneumocystis jirovecii RU7]KTW31731.1 hypothetical protein T551_00992 [Pneumocystis jirovecii RU7]CCJ30294.1 unnamed protein product [Pneumocystis jirovecii]